MQHGLTRRLERCLLAHEIVHAIYDEPVFPRHLSSKIEARCNRVAAEKLIDPDVLSKLAALYPDDPGRVAYELDVTDWILEAYLKAHPHL